MEFDAHPSSCIQNRNHINYVFSSLNFAGLVQKEIACVWPGSAVTVCTVNPSSLWGMKMMKGCLLYFEHACLNSGVLATLNVSSLKCCHPTKVQSFISALWNTRQQCASQYCFLFQSLRCHASIFKPNISPVLCLVPPTSTLMPCPETWVPPLKITDSCDYI